MTEYGGGAKISDREIFFSKPEVRVWRATGFHRGDERESAFLYARMRDFDLAATLLLGGVSKRPKNCQDPAPWLYRC